MPENDEQKPMGIVFVNIIGERPTPTEDECDEKQKMFFEIHDKFFDIMENDEERAKRIVNKLSTLEKIQITRDQLLSGADALFFNNMRCVAINFLEEMLKGVQECHEQLSQMPINQIPDLKKFIVQEQKNIEKEITQINLLLKFLKLLPLAGENPQKLFED